MQLTDSKPFIPDSLTVGMRLEKFKKKGLTLFNTAFCNIGI